MHNDDFTDEENEEYTRQLEDGNKPMKWATNMPVDAKAAIKRTRQVQFLKALSQYGTLTQAAKSAGINPATHRRWLDNDPWFQAQFKEALASYRDLVAEEVHNRAIHGVEVPIIGKVRTELGTEDAIIGYKTVKSDILLMVHAKRVDPSYRENYTPPPQHDGPKEQVSPLTRITITLDTMQERKVIDITPEQLPRNITPLPAPEDDGA